MALSFSDDFDNRVAAATAHIPPDATTNDLVAASRLLSRILRMACEENRVYPDASDLLNQTHHEKTYASLCSRSEVFPLLRQPYTSAASDSNVAHKIRDILQEVRPQLTEIADGSRTYDVWTPTCDDSAHVEHVAALKIPESESQPVLVMHDLGKMIDDDALQHNLSHIFCSRQNTFFVNASGSGKTRLLYEGLCRHWGLYLTAKVDSSRLGSHNVDFVTNQGLFLSELPTLPHTSSSSYEDMRQANFRVLTRRYKDVLLSHALMLREFLDTASPHIQNVHKERWLHCQLQPAYLMHVDPFFSINFALLRASDAYVDHTLQEVLEEIHRRLDSTEPLFATLDEAQSLGLGGDQNNMAYGFPANDARLYLRHLILSWRGRPGLSLVVTGTELPRNLFHDDDPLEMEFGRYRWTSATGAFDAVDSNRGYLLRYLPASFVRKASGKRLLERLGRWLRGRHRLTASFVGLFLRHGLAQPHQLLNDYISNATKYWPNDAEEMVAMEGKRLERAKKILRPISFGALKVPLVRSTVHRSLLQLYLYPSANRHIYAGDHLGVVTEAFGRFVDDEASQIAVDEPFILIACAQWFKDTGTNFLDIGYHRFLPQQSAHVCQFRQERTVLMLARRLECKPGLRELFHFVGTPPSWAHARSTSLLLRHNTAKGKPSVRVYMHTRESHAKSTPALLTIASPEEIDQWLQCTTISPFCLLQQSAESTLLFTLKLSSDKNMWVALDGRQGSSLTADETLHALARMDPSQNFRVERLDEMRNIPNPSRRAGDPPLFLAFASEITNSSDTKAGRTIATMDIDQLYHSVEISADDVLHRVVHFTCPGSPTSASTTAKRPRATETDTGAFTRTSKRRVGLVRATDDNKERVMRTSTMRQRQPAGRRPNRT
ncbi:hypothetical protein BD626DRAFT_565208 [Schizophyllum amplum]|uniref:Uncharacterized protein n=1 Tax=Schizophyllum amplum TaxID=97359 RepID=A0A550CUA5_9AGAR|nr:hypothetical protein BD626DRAFT_565208 [Auriculariopsis ampla]